MGTKAEGSATASLVDGSCHVVDHGKTADGLQKMVVWPANTTQGDSGFSPL